MDNKQKRRLANTRLPENDKFGELMIYIARKSEADSRFGNTKLNKLLFYADMLMYSRTGVPITSHRYQKLAHGPAPIQLLPIRNELIEEGHCSMQDKPYGRYVQKRLIGLREANLDVFTASEIANVDLVIETFWDMNATEVSEISHLDVGWKAAGIQEEIPYCTVLLSDRQLTEQEREFATELEPSCDQDA